MVVDLGEFFPVLLNLFLIILVVVIIIFVIKLFGTLNKVNSILDNVDTKVNQLNGAFDIVDNVTSAINGVSGKVSNFVTEKVTKIIDKKGNDKDE